MAIKQTSKQHLEPGAFYRTAELARLGFATAKVDRELVGDGKLMKLARGLYYCPKQSRFGAVPPEAKALIEAYLQTDQFLITSFNEYNKLGVGLTQLYSETIVYNHRISGTKKLGNRSFRFKRKSHFPSKLSVEFLMVDLINNMHLLDEDQAALLSKVKVKLAKMEPTTKRQMVQQYGTASSIRLLIDEA
jgi:hypothetical protein